MTSLEEVVANSQKLRPRTRQVYQAAIRSFLAFAGAQEHNWTPATVEDWLKSMPQAKGQTLNLYLAGIKYASKRVAALARDPQKDFAMPVEARQTESVQNRLALPLDAVKAVLATCNDGTPISIRDRAILTLGFRTGMRRAGILGITFSDLTPTDVTITLKGGRRHVVYLDAPTKSALGAWLDCLRVLGVQSGPVFRTVVKSRVAGHWHALGPMSESSLYGMIRKRATAIGLSRVSPHVMRHTFVSWCVEQGIPAHRIREVTGHKSDAMIKLYTHDTAAESDPVGAHLPSFED